MCNKAVPCRSSAERAGRLRSQAIQQCCFVCKVSRVVRHLFSVGSASSRMGGASPSSSSPLKLTQGAACFTAFHCFAVFKESSPLLCGLCQRQNGWVLALLLQLIAEAHVWALMALVLGRHCAPIRCVSTRQRQYLQIARPGCMLSQGDQPLCLLSG